MIAIRLHPSTGLTSYHPARAYGENTFKVGSISSNHWDKGHQQPKTLLFNMFGTWFTHIFQISHFCGQKDVMGWFLRFNTLLCAASPEYCAPATLGGDGKPGDAMADAHGNLFSVPS